MKLNQKKIDKYKFLKKNYFINLVSYSTVLNCGTCTFIFFHKKIPPAICNQGPICLLNYKFFKKIILDIGFYTKYGCLSTHRCALMTI